MFSGAAQLVESFFIELAAQLKIRRDLAEIAKILRCMARCSPAGDGYLLSVHGLSGIRGATKITGKLLQRRKEGVGGRRRKIEKALSALNEPIVVVLDDIDRLATSEIRDVFKLVRLTANFPNIIYIVAFDRDRVEKAFDEQGVPGRDYLEKILQVAFDLPVVPSHVLHQQINLGLG